MTRPRGLAADLSWGIFWGLLFSAMFLLLLVVLYVVQGPRMFSDHDTTFGQVALLYVLGGLGGGLIVGFLRPLLRWRWGATLVGALVAVPIGAGVLLMSGDGGPWTGGDTVVTIIFALSLGAPVGWMYWGMFRKEPNSV